MATTATTTIVRHYFGTKAQYDAAQSDYAGGIFICTDTHQLFVKGVEVYSGANGVESITFDSSTRKIKVTYNNGSSVETDALPDATASNATGYGLVSAQAWADLSTNVNDGLTRLATAQSTADAAKSAAATAQSTADTAKTNAATAQSGVDAINSAKGAKNGFASLGSDGKVPSTQLPSYVDDVVEGTLSVDGTVFTPAKEGLTSADTKETDKIYVDTTTNKTYRYSGTQYVEISSSLALGRTSSTAFPGDAGAALEAGTLKSLGKTTTPDTITILPTKFDGTEGDGLELPAAVAKTSSSDGTAGLLTAADKQKYDAGLTKLGTSVSGLKTPTAGANVVTLTPTLNNGTDGTAVDIPEAVAGSKAGVVSGTTAQNIKDNTASRVKSIGNTPAASTVKVTLDLNTATDVSTDLPAATTSKAGVMSATDKANLDTLAKLSVWYEATT